MKVELSNKYLIDVNKSDEEDIYLALSNLCSLLSCNCVKCEDCPVNSPQQFQQLLKDA